MIGPVVELGMPFNLISHSVWYSNLLGENKHTVCKEMKVELSWSLAMRLV
jgi:hypothetical protein